MDFQRSILMCPFMAVGHVTPMLELSKHLVKLGLSVTFLFPGKNLLPRAVSKEEQDNHDERVRFEVVDFGALEVEGGTEYILSPGLRQIDMNKDDHGNFIPVIVQKFLATKKKIQELIEATNPLCVVMDPLFLSNDIVVKDLTTLPIYAFVPFAATSVACFRYVMLNGFIPPTFTISELNFQFEAQDYPRVDIPDGNHPQGYLHVHRNENIHKYCKGLLLNSWDGIEQGSIQALRKNTLCAFPKPLSDSIFGVGPMMSTASSFFRSDREEYSKCKTWLDEKTPSSVLLICFGSWLVLGDEQMEEFAAGLEESGVSFIWVLKSGDRYPWLSGFMERTKERGLVLLGWAPQQYILSHESIGGFVMTSGWNSVMESLILSPRGIVLVTWPIYQDHLPTCRLLVDGLKIAVEVRGSVGGHFGIVKRDEVARAARVAINGPESGEMRERASRLGKMAIQSIAPGGSSYKQLQEFIKEISVTTPE